MSLFGSLFSGVSGLTAQSQAMGMISDNVSNVNTVSYKGAAPKFSTLVTRSAAVSTYSPGGARANTSYRIDQQGLLQGTTRPPTRRSTAPASSSSIAGPMAAATSCIPAPAASSRTSLATCATTPVSISRAGRWTPTNR
jgi:Flagella basal body rod protein